MTEYVILAMTDGPEGRRWIETNRIEASGALTAIRTVLKDDWGETLDEAHNGQYVAIPARSWQPQSVKIETERRVRIG